MIVNLINHTKSEGILQRAFHSLCKESGIDGIYYDAFDFHQGELIPKSYIFIFKFICMFKSSNYIKTLSVLSSQNAQSFVGII